MPRSEPVTRQCCLTRETLPVSELVRFAVGPDGVLAPDIDARAGGRGAWVTARIELVAEAARRNAFARSLKGPVSVPGDLASMAAARLEQRLLGALGLARKAGQVLLGATKVEGALRAGQAIALLAASDGQPDGRRKISAAARSAGFGDLPRSERLSSGQLSLALGSENVIHAALVKGAAGASALKRLLRYEQFMAPSGDRRNEEAI